MTDQTIENAGDFMQVEDGDRLHVYPLDDVKEHELVGEGCGCNPAIGIEDGRVVVEHKSWG